MFDDDLPENVTPIMNPWVVMHEVDDKMQCILAGPPGTPVGQFAMVTADLIRNIAVAFDMDEAVVLALVQKEIKNPTSEVRRLTSTGNDFGKPN